MPEDFAKLSGHAKDLNNQLRMTNTQMNNLENRSGAIAENLAASGRMSGAFSGMLIPQGTIDDINGQFDDLGADAAKLLEDSLAVDFDFSALGEQFADLSLGDLTPEKMAELQAAADGLNIDLNAELIALMDMMTGKSDLDKLDDILTYTFETDEELARFQRMIGLEGEFVGKDLDTGYLTYEFPINESLQNFYDLIGGAYVTDSEGLDGYLDLSFETPDELARFQDLLMMTGDFKDSDFDIKDGTTLLINAERGTELNEFMLLMNGNSGYIQLWEAVSREMILVEQAINQAEGLTELRDMLKGEGDYEGIPGWMEDLENVQMTVNHEIDMANIKAVEAAAEEEGIDKSLLAAMIIGGIVGSAIPIPGVGTAVGAGTGALIHEGIQAHDGGIFSGPTSGFSATLHGTEAVVPLPDGKSIPVSMAGGSGMTFNNTFHVGHGSARHNAREISRIIQDEMKRNLGGATMRGRL
jgi:tetrahydromethanopterin S-methyltransferase subunit B